MLSLSSLPPSHVGFLLGRITPYSRLQIQPSIRHSGDEKREEAGKSLSPTLWREHRLSHSLLPSRCLLACQWLELSHAPHLPQLQGGGDSGQQVSHICPGLNPITTNLPFCSLLLENKYFVILLFPERQWIGYKTILQYFHQVKRMP